MVDDPRAILEPHRDRDRFPAAVVEALGDLNLEPSALIQAWEVSGLAPALDRPGRDRLFAVCLALLATQAQGHTRMSLVPGPGSAAEILYRAFGLGGFAAGPFLEGPDLAPVAGPPGSARPLILAGDWLYTQRLLDHEVRLAEAVRALALRAGLTPAPVDEAVFGDPVRLNAEQRGAVAMALEGALTLITGGPGTGKTSIVVAILRALLRQPGMTLDAIALAAPTGKAAQRMGEAIRASLGRLGTAGPAEEALKAAVLEPRTLHRLLGWHPAAERFRHGPGNPVPARVVIVDEASMISQEHLCLLMGALEPGARLVLLGDAGQLPSVEAGCAFRDLVATQGGRCVELLHSYRMSPEDPDGRNILSVARTLRDPESGSLWEGDEPIHVRVGLDELAFRQVELLEPGAGGMRAFLERWFDKEVTGLPDFLPLARRVYTSIDGAWGEGDAEALAALFRHFDAFRILCALREAGDLRGVEDINRLLHGWMLARTGEGLKGITPFCAGEPVLMTANDYRRGIYNGDQGIVLKVRFGDVLRQAAVFPRLKGFTAFPVEPLKHQLEHAYAMTVHKAQGSEYTRIAIVLPRTDHRALTRELLYTGLTRARKSVVLLAERERIPFAAGNPSRRDSGLAERLG